MQSRTDVRRILKDLQSAKVVVVDQAAARVYLERHEDATPVVMNAVSQVRDSYPQAGLALELAKDPDDPAAETLVLYLRTQTFSPALFEDLSTWNEEIAQRMAASQAWFIVNLDLRASG